MKVNVGVLLVSAIASVSGMLEVDYGQQGYTQNQVRFQPQVVPNRPMPVQMVPTRQILPQVQLPGLKNVVMPSFYDFIGLSKQGKVGGSVTNRHPLLTEVLTTTRNFFRWFLPIPGIIFDGVMALLRLPLTTAVLGTEGAVKFFNLIGEGIWDVVTFPVTFGLQIVRWFWGPSVVIFWPLSAIGYAINWIISGLFHVFVVFPIQSMALISASMVVEAIRALRFVIVTIVNLPLNAVVGFLGSEIAVLNWWG